MILGNTHLTKFHLLNHCPVVTTRCERVMRDETTTGFIPGFSWDWNYPQCNHNEKVIDGMRKVMGGSLSLTTGKNFLVRNRNMDHSSE